MMLFCVTLTLVLEAHRTGRVQLLYWLPLIFLLWANLHIQFIYGLFVVGLLLAVNLAQRLAARLGLAPAGCCLLNFRLQRWLRFLPRASSPPASGRILTICTR